jgi:hypothetical protein
MSQPNDLSRSLVALDQNSTGIAVVELSQSSWFVAGMVVDGFERAVLGNRVVVAHDLGKPDRVADRFEFAVEIDLLQLVDQEDHFRSAAR